LDPTLILVTGEQWKSVHFMFLQEHPRDITLSVQLHGNLNVFKFTSDHNAVTCSCSGRSSTVPTNKCKSGTSDTRGQFQRFQVCWGHQTVLANHYNHVLLYRLHCSL